MQHNHGYTDSWYGNVWFMYATELTVPLCCEARMTTHMVYAPVA